MLGMEQHPDRKAYLQERLNELYQRLGATPVRAILKALE
jgi:hypothetical protein